MPRKVLWNSAKLKRSWKKYDINYSHCFTMFASTNLARTHRLRLPGDLPLNKIGKNMTRSDQIKKLSGKQERYLKVFLC